MLLRPRLGTVGRTTYITPVCSTLFPKPKQNAGPGNYPCAIYLQVQQQSVSDKVFTISKTNGKQQQKASG